MNPLTTPAAMCHMTTQYMCFVLDINECDSDPCGQGSCGNTEGSYTCDCSPGYEVGQNQPSTCTGK